MTIMPSPGFITELRNRSRAEREAAKDLRAHMVKVATWLAEHAPGLDSSQIIGSADELRREAGAIAHAEQLAADYEATAHHMADVLAGQGGQPIEAEARAAVSQPLTPVPDGPAPDRTDTEQPGADRTSPDGPGHARTPVGRIVATTSTIHTDTKPVDVQPKGGAK